ncbi:MAG: bifunctional [glutamate--ammonia ligase]-adenylyl-L-tyrosine phosphorylase/[glutamate--ammonia-ligase] adenylyltransferase [Comamonas sp.]
MANTDITPPQASLPLSAHSRFVQRLHRRYDDLLGLLPDGPPTHATMAPTLAALLAKGHALGAALRILRQLVMARLITLDCDHQADLQTITQGVTELAELTLDAACTAARAELDSRHGAPRDADGQPVQLWIIGMGKLGARELNVSSDIDLIYIYEQEGETAGQPDGRGKLSNHEYFIRAIKLIYQLIGETTEHGFVFRVDLMLRPHGNSGPAAISVAALEDYLQTHGREWERFAWLKSRIVAPLADIRSPNVQALRGAVLPFVFRRYLDYAVFDSLRSLHRQIREHAAKRSAGHPERANDVKLSRGGIREIEFIVQLLQVVRGGQFPELRCRATLEALPRLERASLMAPETAQALADAYIFLRKVEHRIQYLDDQQTHVLPTRDDDLLWMAQTLGYDNECQFLHQLDAHRELVAQEFDKLLGGNEACKGGQCGGAKGAAASAPELDSVLPRLPEAVRERVLQWQRNPRYSYLSDAGTGRLVLLLQRTAQWLSQGLVSEIAAVRLADWMESLLRRESYLAMLQERPAVHEKLMHMLGAAKWPARYMLQHPGVIDELASDALMHERFNPQEFEADLDRRRAALQSTAEDDDENLLNLLRRAQHAETFRTLARDVEQQITVEQVADDLSALADAVLRVTTRWCWSRLKSAHRAEPQFGIIGYGKLGGKELGYGSDLDIVFVFDDDDERAPEVYSAFVRKLISWLTVKTGEGDLFEIDTALRPNGSSGLLVTSFDSYANYQQQRGSNTAWTWEHQAMTRSRFVLGSPSLAARFDAVREAVITAPRDAASLRSEIATMRERVRSAHPVPAGLFDVKHSVGGMMDVEFVVQYLVLLHSACNPALRPNLGNITLLRRAESAGLLPAGMGEEAANAYRALRRVQHVARLNEAPTQVPDTALQIEQQTVRALWAAVLQTG